MKPHPLTHPVKFAAGLLAVLLAAAHVSAASVAISTARNAMRTADYVSMVSTLDTYLAANPSAADAQEARLLRAIGRAGVIAKNNLPAFLIQKGATSATLDPFAGNEALSIEFPMCPQTSTGKPWTKSGDSYSLSLQANSNNYDYLLAWRNTGTTTRTFTINCNAALSGANIYFGTSVYLNGDYIGHLSLSEFYGGSGPDSPISDITKDGDGNITSFAITLAPGRWLTFAAYGYTYSGNSSGTLTLTLTPASALDADVEVTTGTVPYDALPALANDTNLADIVTFLGAQQTAINDILADLDAIPSGFSTEFVSAETGMAGTVVVQYADVQMLAGLLKSSQALHHFLKTYNLNVDLTNFNIVEAYTSALTGDWRADDFIIDHPNLLRPTAAATAGNADCQAMHDLLAAAIDKLLAVETTLFTRPAPASGKSYLFGVDHDGQTQADYHNNLDKLRAALTGPVDFDRSRLPATARGSLAPLFGNKPLDLRDLFEFSPRGIPVGGSQNFRNSGLLTGVSEYQWETYLRDIGIWALGGRKFGYYDSYWHQSDFTINIENGAAANLPLPYYPAGVFGSGAAALSWQWQLRHETANWWDDPSFTSITGATSQTLDLALLTDSTNRGAYLEVGYPGDNKLIGTAANVWVDWRDTAVFDPAFTIIHSPLSQFIKTGQPINLWVGTDAISNDMQYKWYKNNQLIPGATSALYTIPGATAGDAGKYHVVVSNRAKTLTSDTARLVVPATAIVTGVAVAPASATVVKGETRQFTATVTGSGAAMPSQGVTWSVTGAADADTGVSAGLLTVAAGETAAALTVRATSFVDPSKSGAASVTVVDPVLNVTPTLLPLAQPGGSGGTFDVSGNVSWTVQIPPPATGWLTATPASGTAGGTVTLNATANTTGAPRTTDITVTGAGLTRTVTVTQASSAAPAAPHALANGATLTLTHNGGLVETLTVATGGKLQPASGSAIPYDYAAAGNAATLVFDGTTWVLGFTSGTAGAFNADNGSTGTFAYALPAAATYTLTVRNGSGSGPYTAGTTVPLIADPAPAGQVFDKWTTNAGGSFANDGNSNTTFTMPAGTVTVTATYKNQSTNPGGGGNSGGGGGGGGGTPMLPGLALLAVLLALRARRK
jgi:hypothetical protein